MLAILFSIFVLGELLVRFGLPGELTRKIVHLFSGLTIVFIPFVWNLPHTLLVGLVFTIFLFLSDRKKWLNSINGVTRPTVGGVLFPLGLSLAAALSWNTPLAFQVSVLILAVSDTIAWIVGKGYLGKQTDKQYSVSFIFGLSVFSILLLVGLMSDSLSWWYLVAGLFYSGIISAIENRSHHGSDNLFVPAAASVLGLAIF